MHLNQKLEIRSFRLVATLGVAMIMLLSTAAAWAEARVAQLSGDVEIGRGEPPVWEKLLTSATIAPNDRIRTGADGRVEIAMDAGTLRVHENSVLRLPPPVGDADQVELEQGHSLFDVLRRAGRRFEVHTPTVVVSVKGTRFSVDASSELGEVAVYRGMVGVREADQLDHTMETLVREGFLATGGPGSAIELDVAPSGDPWASWQDFGRNVREAREKPKRMKGIDRAKTSLLRETEKDVLNRAVERKPEVAEQLRKEKKRAAQSRGAKKSVPAAAAPRGDDQDDTSMRYESRERLREIRDDLREGQIAEENVSNGSGGSGGDGGIEDTFDWSIFENGPPGLLMRIATARDDVEQQYQAAGGGWSADDIENALITSLVGDGMNPSAAAALVNNLLN